MAKDLKIVAGKSLEGEVVSNKMEKTVVVNVKRTFRHPIMGKVVNESKKYKVHDENGMAQPGDLVEIRECRPLSKDKHMVLERVIRKAQV